ncbi:hypothetical protein LR48_Vigan2350s000100 [Vigna angularis]|nr:hypothetical protein LR48_Vigan2350s000100 [Vigna angularis]
MKWKRRHTRWNEGGCSTLISVKLDFMFPAELSGLSSSFLYATTRAWGEDKGCPATLKREHKNIWKKSGMQ